MSQAMIDRIAGGFREAQVLLTACRLGLFDVLQRGPQNVEQIATVLDTDLRGTRILLEALAGLSLIERRPGGYANSKTAQLHLVSDAPASLLAQMRHKSRLYHRWGHLIEAVRSGAPVSEQVIPQELEGSRTAFAEAMADSARNSAQLTAQAVDLDGVARMLDVGGGPGTFAEAFVRQSPRLHVTILDDAETLEVARSRIAGRELTSRIALRPGDVFEDDLGGPYDLILVSNVIHLFPAPDNHRLVGRCVEVLAPRGRLLLKDFFLPDEGEPPTWSLLFAVNMLAGTNGGECYSAGEAIGWMETSGLRLVQQIPITERSLVLVGRQTRGG